MLRAALNLGVAAFLAGCATGEDGAAETTDATAPADAADGSTLLDATRDSASDSRPSDSLFPTEDAASGLTSAAAARSCKAIRGDFPASKTGVYWLVDGATPYQAFCDMTLDGGGWTAFFAGTNGSPNVFAQFEDAGACTEPATKCLRRVPALSPPIAEIAATCGESGLKFKPSAGALAYFTTGTQAKWQPLNDVTAIAGSANTAYATFLFTGDGTSKGWIISSNIAKALTFSNSYKASNVWDFCDGSSNTTAAIKLLYR